MKVKNFMKKFAAFALGLGMTVGVSYGLGNRAHEVDAVANVVKADELRDGKYIITATYNSKEYYLAPKVFSAKGSSAVEFNSATADEDLGWNFKLTGSTWTIKLDSGEGLYFTNDNNGVACAANKGANMTIAATSTGASTVYITGSDGTNTRYLALYQGSNWRCYKTTSSGVPSIKLYAISSSTTKTATGVTIAGDATRTIDSTKTVGYSETLTATVKYSDAADDSDVKWVSSDTDVATVDGGKVTFLKAGSAKITAKAKAKKVYDEVEPKVKSAYKKACKEIDDAVAAKTGKKKATTETVMKAIKKKFKPEIINRFSGIVVFNSLGREEMKKIYI